MQAHLSYLLLVPLALLAPATGCDDDPSRPAMDAGADLGEPDLTRPRDGLAQDAGRDATHAPDGGAPDAPSALPFLAGVNLASAEFGSSLPGTYDKDYTYPTQAEVDYFVTKGMNVFRLPFRWERLQPSEKGALDSVELGRVDAFVAHATARGAHVVLDPHNYARYYGQLVGTEVGDDALADLWSKLAAHFKANPKVIFGLMNEPHDMTTELWRDDANAAIQAIRAAGATNLILVPGNGWTGAQLGPELLRHPQRPGDEEHRRSGQQLRLRGAPVHGQRLVGDIGDLCERDRGGGPPEGLHGLAAAERATRLPG